jgi:uncharacterized protein YndB with AHSA1/START domain
MTQRSIAHGSFTIERHYDAGPARVYQAFADPNQKKQWFGEGEPGTGVFDFREGGREYNTGKMGGDTYAFDCNFRDIVPDVRIVYAYEMHLNGQRISVSVASLEFRPEGAGTHLVVTEHGMFLDGLDNVEQRREGTEQLMDLLGGHLAKV